MESPKIMVIIPVINEEEAIPRVLGEIPTQVSKVIVVDGGSTDRTVERALHSGAGVVHEKRKGYGLACLRGMQEAREADVIVFLDGDYSDYPGQMTKLIAPILADQADLVIGSRLSGYRERGAMLPHAWLANVLFSRLLYRFCRLKVTDIGPFRAIRAQQLFELNMGEPDYGWTLEMMIKAVKHGLRVVEVPVDYRKRMGHSKISGSFGVSLWAGVKMFYTLRYLWH